MSKKNEGVRIFEKANPDKICQGDIFSVLEPDTRKKFTEVVVEDYKIEWFIVISNTCDIKQKDVIKYLHFCPLVPLKNILMELKKDYESRTPVPKPDTIKNNLEGFVRENLIYKKKRFYYLPEKKYFKIKEQYLILLDAIITLDKKTATEMIKDKRICSLKSPWKEKLGWAVGNIHNRVSLKDYSEKQLKDALELVEK